MPISKLSFSNVGPFDQVEFEFDPQVNVFTGPNNSGKSSVLWVLGDVAVYPFTFPQKLLRRERAAGFELHFQSDSDLMLPGGQLHIPLSQKLPGRWGTAEFELYFQSSSEGMLTGQLPCQFQSTGTEYRERHRILELTYDHATALTMIGYSKFIPALRWNTGFRSSGPTLAQKEEGERQNPTLGRRLPRRPIRSWQTGEEERESELRKRLALVSRDASLVSDEEVIQEIVDLDYRSYLRDEPTFRNIIAQIGEVATEITDGFPIRFSGVGEDEDGFFPEFGTVDGQMPLNTMSQGTQSIVQWLAHLLIGYAAYYDFPKNLKEKPGVLIIDEIDAHLHPSWQRRIIPALTKHFPNLQIFCSTHSPLMLAGLKAGQVHLLQRDESNKVTVSRNEVDIAGWSADEILRSFLGVPDPTDQETVDHLEKLRKLRRKRDLSPEESEELERLRDAVSEELLRGPIAAQMERFDQALERAQTSSDC